MDWVHCNTCFVQPGTSNKKFLLTSCGHVFCTDCVQGSATQTCSVCKSSCSAIPLTSNLKPDVEIFFMDPGDLLKKQQKQFIQVLEFQKSHRKRLNSHHQKNNNTDTSCGGNTRRWQEMERELKKLVEENIMLKKMLGAMHGDQKRGGTSSRPGTPAHHTRGVSPGQSLHHQRSGHYSTSSHGQTSPYSRSAPVTPQMMNSIKPSQRETPKTPAGPIRLTMRTPPSNGMLGRIGTPPSGRLRTTPGIVANLLRAGNTPGGREAKTPTTFRASLGDSQMSGNSPKRHYPHSDPNSINSSQTWSNSQQSQRISSVTDPSLSLRHQTSSDSLMTQYHPSQTARNLTGSTQDGKRRQIQLHYQPRQAGHK